MGQVLLDDLKDTVVWWIAFPAAYEGFLGKYDTMLTHKVAESYPRVAQSFELPDPSINYRIPHQIRMGIRCQDALLEHRGALENRGLFRTTDSQDGSLLFDASVGELEFTPSGLKRGCRVDSISSGTHTEFKFGYSELTLEYQLKLENFESLVKYRNFEIVTNRPVAPELRTYASDWGIKITYPEILLPYAEIGPPPLPAVAGLRRREGAYDIFLQPTP